MEWAKNLAAAIAICDKDGIITYLNDSAAAMYVNSGGYALVGQSLLACHQQSSTDKIAEIMQTRRPHAYTTEKKGIKRLIYQAPHIEQGEVVGIVELAIEIPFDMPHHIRS